MPHKSQPYPFLPFTHERYISHTTLPHHHAVNHHHHSPPPSLSNASSLLPTSTPFSTHGNSTISNIISSTTPIQSSTHNINAVQGPTPMNRLNIKPKFARSVKSTLITREDITNLMHLNLKDASARLQISDSHLKKLCRRFEIQHWPSRQIISKNRIISTMKQSLKMTDDPAEIDRMKRAIDKLVKDIEILKQQVCATKANPPSMHPPSLLHPASSSAAEIPLFETHEVHSCQDPISDDNPDLSEDFLFQVFNEVEENLRNHDEENENLEPMNSHVSASLFTHPQLSSNSHRSGPLQRKRRRYSRQNSTSVDSLGMTNVQTDQGFQSQRSNPYLSSSFSTSSSILKSTSSDSTTNNSSINSFNSSFSSSSPSPCLHSSSNLIQTTPPQQTSRIDNTSSSYLTANGLVKQLPDSNLYVPFSVVLAPLIHSPKLKKHQVIQLLEPDIGITSTTSYFENPVNSYTSASSSYSTTSINHIPSLFFKMNEKEKREQLILSSIPPRHLPNPSIEKKKRE